MNRNRIRAAFGAASVVALLATGAGASPALAASSGDHGARAAQGVGQDKSKDKSKEKSKDGKGKGRDKAAEKKLEKRVAQLEKAFTRLLRKADRVGGDVHERLTANIAADLAGLAELTTAAQARDLQPENYVQVIARLDKVADLTAQVEAPDVALVDATTAVVDQLLSISAASEKDELRTARTLYRALKDLVEAAQESEDEDEGEDEDEDDGGEDTPDTGV